MQQVRKLVLFIFVLFPFHKLSAQSFKIGTLDIYGNRKINTDTILAHLSWKEGDSINVENFKKENEVARLKQISGVKYATIDPVCCDTANNLMLYIGIGESNSFTSKYRNAPGQDIRLPVEMINAYHNYTDQIEPAIKSGQGGEDDSQGYALINYLPGRNEQKKFIGFATKNFSLLIKVLRNSKYPEERAVAAQIIAYSNNKKEVVNNLLYAVNDSDDEVRNNATRALGILAGYALSHPELKILIPPAPFIEMVNSIVWTDRNKGASVLMELTETRDPKLLNEIKQKAMPSIIEMARWKDRNHSYSSFVILGRIAGVDEKELPGKNFSKGWEMEIKKMTDQCCR